MVPLSDAQLFAFDKGYSIWMLITAAGGEFYDLAGPENGVGILARCRKSMTMPTLPGRLAGSKAFAG